MKKYLMIGFVAAVAFSSCSKNDFETTTQEQIDQAKYDQAFENYVGGKVASNQDWGFGASTRAFTRGSYPNGNMWADEGWNVPPVLTDGQKERVYRYFQTHKDLEYKDPGYTDFWIQQVYKGGTHSTNECPEKYTSANNGQVTGSDHMDHLEAVLEDGTHEHIFNFNFGDCNDWGGRMLMTNSGTHLFGYFNSDGSLGHTDYTGLVSWEVIEKWGNDNNIGATLNDGWNRSFMGFDFEQVVGDDILRRNITEYSSNGKPKTWTLNYVTWSDFQSKEYIKNGTEILPWADYVAKYPEFKYNGNLVKMLVSGTNEYCGQNTQLPQSDVYHNVSVNIPKWDPNVKDENGNVVGGYVDDWQEKSCLDLDAVYAQLALKKLPVDTKQMCEYVLVQGGADGYYSDWIVTLIEATNCDLRIIAEDLNANQSDNDWDFNDIVLDIKYGTTAETTKVILRAAGGTMKLRIAENDDWEVHKLFGVDVNTMVNTNWTGSNSAKKDPVVVPYDKAIPNATAAKALKLEVFKNGTWQELTANTGEPACKIGVKPSFKWLNERSSIKKQYPEFTKWVTEDPTIIWY